MRYADTVHRLTAAVLVAVTLAAITYGEYQRRKVRKDIKAICSAIAAGQVEAMKHEAGAADPAGEKKIASAK